MNVRTQVLAAAMTAVMIVSLRAAPAADDAAIESAKFLLSKSVTVGQDRSFHEMLRALRHMRDPSLAPLWEHLAASDRAILQIHGILGLAEISPQKRADLKRIIGMTDALAQAELITAALDDKLLDADDCAQLVVSEGLDPAVRLLVANELVRQGKPLPPKLLDEAVTSDNIGRQHLAALLQLQLGDPRGSTTLGALNKLSDEKRDGVRRMVLDTALKYEHDKIGPWAMEVASEPGLNPLLDGVALQAALRFKAPGAEDLWQRQYQSSTDAAQQMRLALLAVRMSLWVNPRLFAPLKASTDPVLKQLGVAGEAISLKQNVAPAVVGLVQLYHPAVNRVALAYAHEDATPQDAKVILLATILAYDQGPRELKGRLLDDAMTAAQLLYEKTPDEAVAMLRPILVDPKTDERIVHGILLGLVRTQTPGGERVIAGLPPFVSPHVSHVATLLKAKSNTAMTDEEMADLALLVRGGGRLQETLRAQAAWSYVRRVGQAKPVLAAVLKG